MIFFVRLFSFVLFLLIATACDGKNSISKELSLGSMGLIPIGATTVDQGAIASTDCGDRLQAASDCSAVGKDGLRYTFFDGALSIVSANSTEVDSRVTLPAGIRFGRSIEDARNTLVKAGIVLEAGTTQDRRVVYTSAFALTSALGIICSIELVADAEGALAEVILRTDF